MGNSAISPIIRGTTGPTGPTGPIGPTGHTGTGTGLTGNSGRTGIYVFSVIPDTPSKRTLIVYSSGFAFLNNTKGPTGYTGTMYGENLGSGLTLYSAINGFTLSVKGLSFIGNLTAEVTGGTILVTPLDVSYGVTLASGIANDRVLYAKTSSIIDSTRIQLGKTYNNFAFSNIQGITPGSLPVYSELQGNVIEVPAGGNNVILGLTLGSIYKINTPIGLSGFTLDPSLYGNNELLSFTFFIEGNGFTQFPSNVYFEDSPYSSVFGCGMNTMNLMTYDKGQNWFATIADRGYGVSSCSAQDSVGSCCYVGASGDRECVEYVTQGWCDGQSGSTFSAMTACDPLCRETAICCSSGQCIEGVNKEECEYFLGKYYKGVSCSSEDICRIPSPAISCCTGGTCIDSISAALCNSYYGGTVVSGGGCCQVNCDTVTLIAGACCTGGTCSTKTPDQCLADNGVFYGDGVSCADVNCCFPQGITQICCRNGICIFPIDASLPASVCLSGGGTVVSATSCSPQNCTIAPQEQVDVDKGLCCGKTSQWTNVTREECKQKDSDAYFYPNLIIGSRAHNPYKWVSGGTYQISEGVIGETGADCIFCSLFRKVLVVLSSAQGDDSIPPQPIYKGIESRCVWNRPDIGDSLSLEIFNRNDWVIRSATGDGNKAQIGYFSGTGGVGASFNKDIISSPCCGSISYEGPVPGITGLTYCSFDPFTMGHIFDSKFRGASLSEDPNGYTFDKFILGVNPSQSEMRNFIFGSQTGSGHYVGGYINTPELWYGDMHHKVCRSKCANLDISRIVQIRERCGCNCDRYYNFGNNFSPCDIIGWSAYLRILAENYQGQAFTERCRECGLSACENMSTYVFAYYWNIEYCNQISFYLPSNGEFLVMEEANIPYFRDPTSVGCTGCDYTVKGNRCDQATTCGTDNEICASMDCLVSQPSNNCLNLPDCRDQP